MIEIETINTITQCFWLFLALFGVGFVLAIIWSVYLHRAEKKYENKK